MKKKILLVDDSLTVQKVVALTLDRNRFQVAVAKNRVEALKAIKESIPDLILVSDQVADVNVQSFPKEIEATLGRDRYMPPMLLITSQDIKEARHYQGILRKPFSPQVLQALVNDSTRHQEPPIMDSSSVALSEIDEQDDGRMQKMFNETFSDEAQLMKQTFQNQVMDEEKTVLSVSPPIRVQSQPARPAHRPSAPAPGPSVAELWGGAPSAPEKQEVTGEISIETDLKKMNLEALVKKTLEKMLPPIVEKLVQERLDRLMSEQEDK